VTEIERITQSPETLGGFLRSLPIIEGPWDTAFQATYCAGCAAEDCGNCQHEEKRNNPAWWLTLEAGTAVNQ
jgi:hypothetical protein